MSFRNLTDLATSVSTTLDAVSAALGLDGRLLKNIAAGYQGMPSDLLAPVANVLGVDVTEVIYACPRVIKNWVDGWHNPQQLPFNPVSVSPAGGIVSLGFQQGTIPSAKGYVPFTGQMGTALSSIAAIEMGIK